MCEEHTVTLTHRCRSFEVTVPAGYLHLTEVKARPAWAGVRPQEVLTGLRLEGVPDGVSPTCYRFEDVLEAERGSGAFQAAAAAEAARRAEKAAEQQKLAARAAQLVPRRPAFYARDEVYARAALIKRGWTDTHITRLLGEPDYTEPAARGQAYFYAIERIETAEATDAKLQARLDKVTPHRGTLTADITARQAEKRAARQAERAAAYEAAKVRNARAAAEEATRREDALRAQAAQRVIFRKDARHGWCIDGPDLQPGQSVTVTKRDGQAETVTVTNVLTRSANGVTRATFRRPQSATSEVPAPATAGNKVRLYPAEVVPTPGQTTRIGDTLYVAVGTVGKPRRIREEDWDVHSYGDLGGCEGMTGYWCELRPATAEDRHLAAQGEDAE